MPSMTPIASLYAAIPLSGALIALFAVEQLVNGWKHGFDHPPDPFEGDRGQDAAEAIERAGAGL
jgi:TRAP-type C4-dicarboxylate transport system permease small subunit